MSLFDHFRRKKTMQSSTDEPAAQQTEAQPDTLTPEIEIEPEPEFEPTSETSPDVLCSAKLIMRELRRSSDEFPADLELAETFISVVQGHVRKYLDSLDTQPEQENLDAGIKIFIAPKRMAAFLYALPPVGDGRAMDKEMIETALKEAGVIHGILEETVSMLEREQLFFRLYPIARGTEPVNGEDGKVIDHYPREKSIHLMEDEKGTVNHKDLNIFQSIKMGDIICDIIPPTEGQDGTDVTGKTVRAIPGKKAEVPRGKNTLVTEDGSSLMSSIDGDITFENRVFRVERQLTINQNVDTSTGNLDFGGDILITGDVRSGFRIHAAGNITVFGLVENAELTAGGNIDIKKGMNGNGKGLLEADGSVTSRFLEHTTVKAGKDVTSETIINCNISSGGSVYALTGKGIIIGGMITAIQCVEARKIGSLSGIETILKLNYSLKNEENIDFLEKKIAEYHKTLDMLNKNITYLQGLPSLSADKKVVFDQLREQKNLYSQTLEDMEKELDAKSNMAHNLKKCHVRGDTIYGPTSVTLGFSTLTVKDTSNKCNIYYTEENGLVAGTF